jgi:hypothetical protein
LQNENEEAGSVVEVLAEPGKLYNTKSTEASQVIENMERETRIELATNSLEDCVAIENKEQMRPWRGILTTRTTENTALATKRRLTE